MACASCISCNISFNASSCPSCGADAISDEIFAPEDGGAFPQFTKRRAPKEKPSFFSLEERVRANIEQAKREGKFHFPPLKKEAPYADK